MTPFGVPSWPFASSGGAGLGGPSQADMREMPNINGPMMGATSVTPDIQGSEAIGSLHSTIHSFDALVEEVATRNVARVEEGSGAGGWQRTKTWLSGRPGS
jgi:hypothetical protein